MNNMEDDFKSSVAAMIAVMSRPQDLPFPDQLALAGMIYEMGNKCKIMAKNNNIDIIPLDAEDDFTKLGNIQWGVRRYNDGKK